MKAEIKKDITRGIETIAKLKEAYDKKELLDFINIPDEIIPSNMEKGSNHHLLFLTFVSGIAYLRKEEQLWNAARMTLGDENTSYVFNPEQVLKTPIEKLEKDLNKYHLFEDVLQARKWSIGHILFSDKRRARKNDINIWLNMAKFLNDFDSDIQTLFKKYDNDVFNIIDLLMKEPYSQCFPEYHKRRKIIVWITRLKRNSNIILKQAEKLSMPIGIHIIRATFMSGSIIGSATSLNLDLDDLCVEFWQEVYKVGKDKIKLIPLEFEIFLWILGKYGCSVSRTDNICRFKGKCPIAEFCSSAKIEMLDGFIKINVDQNQKK